MQRKGKLVRKIGKSVHSLFLCKLVVFVFSFLQLTAFRDLLTLCCRPCCYRWHSIFAQFKSIRHYFDTCFVVAMGTYPKHSFANIM